MLNRSQTTTFLEIFYELLLYSQVILKSMRVADDTLEGISECEWIKNNLKKCGKSLCVIAEKKRALSQSDVLKNFGKW